MIINFGEEEKESRIASALSEYGITIIDYPRHYEGCPLLSVEVIHHFLNSSESWLSVSPQNFLIMHSELGGWPVLAFMVAALLVYRKNFSIETKALEMVHKQAPLALLHEASPMNPVPSQLRYLQYILTRNADTEWPPVAEKVLTLDSVTMRMIPDFDGKGGCCPIFRIYGRNPLLHIDKSPKLLFSTPRRSKNIRYYNQEESDLVEIDINCHMQDDIVLECISLHDDMVCEKIMYRAMFNTGFIKSNMLILNRDEIDIYWDAKDRFPKNFRVELYFSELDGTASVTIPVDLSCFDQEGLPVEAFANVQEMFNIHDNDDGSNRPHQRALREIINKMMESSFHHRIASSNLLQTLPKRNNQDTESEGLTQERATTSVDEKILCNIELRGAIRLIPVRSTPGVETSEEQQLDSEIRPREIPDADLTAHATTGPSIPEAGPLTSAAATPSDTLIMNELHWIREFMIEERQHRNWLQQAVLGLAAHMHYQGLPPLPQPVPAPENTPAEEPKGAVLQTDRTELDTKIAPTRTYPTPPATSLKPADETASPKPGHP